MAENSEIVSKEENPKAGSNGFSLIFPKFNLQFPFFKPKPKAGFSGEEDGERKAVVDDERNQSETQKPDMVKFPKAQLVAPPPVAVESEEHGKTSNPVYALGGFLVLRWIWARWNERKERKDKKEGSSDEDQSAE
ncbi:hypothetical protein FEM48_Zijuj03G0047200 [Ziziphus jujuba var. spinosa]|uniref:Uncharacterized protein n=1 Tax=Ziziphus jujuba var. spinosa TaxID=714518 RepID=A0A978VN90_ZIZJJ|nr:hypothetical protein FEM48_Zijuj03G0047200 [Ziziphus jujuba var. spinosa]